MSKQSNQRYRKEVEKDHLQKAGIDKKGTDAEREKDNKIKFNNEFDTTSDNSDHR